jgi:hypothetical protein
VLVGNNGSAGSLELSAGTLNASDGLIVACGAKVGTPASAFTLSGGTVNKSGSNQTIIGDVRGSVGTMVMSNSAVFNTAGGAFVVSAGNGTGTLTVNGGTLNQTVGDFVVANGNGRGTVNLYGGTVSNFAGTVYIGYGAGGVGALTVTAVFFAARTPFLSGNSQARPARSLFRTVRWQRARCMWARGGPEPWSRPAARFAVRRRAAASGGWAMWPEARAVIRFTAGRWMRAGRVFKSAEAAGASLNKRVARSRVAAGPAWAVSLAVWEPTRSRVESLNRPLQRTG